MSRCVFSEESRCAVIRVCLHLYFDGTFTSTVYRQSCKLYLLMCWMNGTRARVRPHQSIFHLLCIFPGRNGSEGERMSRKWEIICSDALKCFSDRGAACDSASQAVCVRVSLSMFFSLLFMPDWALTSFQRAPALLDTYTLGLLAKFLPTEPASRGHKDT